MCSMLVQVILLISVTLLSCIRTTTAYRCSRHTYGDYCRLKVAATRQLVLRAKDVKVTNLDTKSTIVIESGKPLSLACTTAGLRLAFQCKIGSCQSCEMVLDGKIARACITKVPEKAAITIRKKKASD